MSTNTPPGGSPLRRDLTLAAWQVVYEQRATSSVPSGATAPARSSRS
jgi:hypothetical protein